MRDDTQEPCRALFHHGCCAPGKEPARVPQGNDTDSATQGQEALTSCWFVKAGRPPSAPPTKSLASKACGGSAQAPVVGLRTHLPSRPYFSKDKGEKSCFQKLSVFSDPGLSLRCQRHGGQTPLPGGGCPHSVFAQGDQFWFTTRP